MARRLTTVERVRESLRVLRVGAAGMVLVIFFVVPPALHFWNSLFVLSVPLYNPASHVQEESSETGYTRHFETQDNYAAVARFFEGEFKKAGWTMTSPRTDLLVFTRRRSFEPQLCVEVSNDSSGAPTGGPTRVTVQVLKGGCFSKDIVDRVCRGGEAVCEP